MIGFPQEQKTEREKEAKNIDKQRVDERKRESGKVKKRKSEGKRNVKH